MVGKKLSEILTRGVHAVGRSETFRDALSIMRDKKISMLVVIDAAGPAGVITERDVICALSRGVRIDDVKAEDIMSAPVVTASTDMNVYDAHMLFAEKGIHHIVVVSPAGGAAAGALVEGVVTQTDIIRHMGPEYFIELKSVSRVMDRCFKTAGATEAVSEVIGGMTRWAHGMVVVVDDARKPVGVITERDAVRLLHDGIDISRAVASDVMNAPVVTVSEDSTLVGALSTMKDKGFRRMVVVDHDGAVSGVVTQKDILKGLETAYIKELREMTRSLGERLKRASEDLKGKSALLDGLFSGAVENVRVVTDADMNVQYFSPAAELIFGMALEEVRGRSLAEIYRKMGVDNGNVAVGVDEVARHGEYIFTAANETAIGGKFLECKLAAINDDNGKPAAYALFCRDITEERNERELARCVMDTSQELLCMVDFDGRFEYVNGAWKDRLGYGQAELLSRRFMDFVHPDDREGTSIAFKRILAGEPLGPFENRYMARDGSTRRLSWRVHLRRESDRFIYGVATDVTESRLAETAMHFHGDMLQHLGEAAFAVRADDFVIVYANRKFSEMFGYGENELVGRHVSTLNAADEGSGVERACSTDALVREGIWRGEVHNVTKSGKRFWTYTTIAPIDHPEMGRIYVCLKTDITRRLEAEAERDRFIEHLKSSLSGTGALPRFIPICAYCKQIRDEEGAWRKFETYITERTGSDFSHGICEPCAKRLMDEVKR